MKNATNNPSANHVFLFYSIQAQYKSVRLFDAISLSDGVDKRQSRMQMCALLTRAIGFL